MFNLLVKYTAWAASGDKMPADRMLEYTDDHLVDRFRPNGRIDLENLLRLPALFVEETHSGGGTQIARIGTIFRARNVGRAVTLEYLYDSAIPALTNEELEGMASELGIANWEFSRTHWAVKDTDLFLALLRNAQPRRPRPRVFTLYEPEKTEPSLVSAMMPFHPAFDEVYATLGEAAKTAGLKCRRVDDIWENPAVIQDVVSLIDRSRVVIGDCSGRNPNVFYEIGIAHTLGREVILIAQSEADIPFDLRHLRFIPYLNNGEGRAALAAKLSDRLSQLVASEA